MSEREPESIDFEDELRKSLLADPFLPFEIVVTSGDRYSIIDPSAVTVVGNSVVHLPPKRGMQIFRKNQIVAVHVNEPIEVT